MRWLDFFGFLRLPPLNPPLSKGGRRGGAFSAWQVELTTRCPLSCRMCIREEAGDWLSGDMRIDDFRKLTPYFKEVETVVLEGWGESLLHSNIIEAIRLVKAEGARAGFVTSGRVLNREYISELITAGVDFVGFSLSGATPQTHDSIRVNSDLRSLIRHIHTFNEIKADKKTKNPKLHIIYLMLRDNISEAPALLQLAKELGIDEVVLTNLIHITNEWQESQRVFRCDENSGHGLECHSRKSGNPDVVLAKAGNYTKELDSRFHEKPWIPVFTGMTGKELQYDNKNYEDLLKETEAKARELKITLRTHPLSPVDVAVCEENPLRNLYISVDGEVSPCVYLHPPVPSPFKRIFCGNMHETEKVSFGNIFREPFHAIWNKKEYREFRERFILRKRRREKLYSPFLDIERLKRFEVASLPDPPEQCRTCHKMLGV